KTQREKFKAVIDEIEEAHQQGQPVLVGTISVDASELLSRMLKRKNIIHNVLNAKNHGREADIVARAGQRGSVTIATNMAGRGTDIKLGEGVVHLEQAMVKSFSTLDEKQSGGSSMRKLLEEKPSGLRVIGTERHESRRIDRQLRGRCARQGDPGFSRFYVSLEDDLMRLFGSDRISGIMEKLGIEEGERLEHPWLNKSIERAQRKVEQHNFSIRKRTLEYDDVMNKQREIIYGFRKDVLTSEKPRDELMNIVDDIIHTQAESVPAADPQDLENDPLEDFVEWANTTFPVGIKRESIEEVKSDAEAITERTFERVKQAYELKAKVEDDDALSAMERHIMMQAIDTHWQEYLRNMDALRQGVGLRAYGQRDPLVEYKHEAYEMFSDLMDKIKNDVCSKMFRSATSLEAFESFLSSLPQMTVHDEVSVLGAPGGGAAQPAPARQPAAIPAGAEDAMQAALQSQPAPMRRDEPKVGRNDPCPCGSGRKYKKCCGAG
ncbi:MAG: SEC-C metal-binding domain-containing protein, partial [Verrucomicrobiota bacterium]